MELVYMDGKKEPYTTSEIVAECAAISHHAIQEHIRKRKDRLERYGIIAFEMRKLNGRGRPEKLYRLNEQQATLLITFLKNTKQVANFKENLVKAFFEMRDEVAEFKLQRALERPKRKTLHDSIEIWLVAPKAHLYAMIDLADNAILQGDKKQALTSLYFIKTGLEYILNDNDNSKAE